MWGWHVPVAYEAALRNSALHACEHASFLLVARSRGGRSTTVAAASAAPPRSPRSSVRCRHGARRRDGAAPHRGIRRTSRTRSGGAVDQQLAGVIMWAFGGMAAVIVGAGLFAVVAGHVEPPEPISKAAGGPRRRHDRALDRRPTTGVEVRRQRPQPRVPRQLVVPARRDRDVLLRHPRLDRRTSSRSSSIPAVVATSYTRGATSRYGASICRRRTSRRSSSASTCAPDWSYARSITGRRTSSWARSSSTCAASSSRAGSVARARSTG